MTTPTSLRQSGPRLRTGLPQPDAVLDKPVEVSALAAAGSAALTRLARLLARCEATAAWQDDAGMTPVALTAVLFLLGVILLLARHHLTGHWSLVR